VWVVLPDPLSARIFFDCGIVEGLHERLGAALRLVFLLPHEDAAEWAERAQGIATTQLDELYPPSVGAPEKALRRADRWLDRQIGFYPLAIRQSLREGFHRERMQPGHRNWFLDPTRVGPLPRWDPLERVMFRWHYSALRYLPSALRAALRRERPAIVLSNVQMQIVVPLLVAGRRLGLPLVGYVASWDHTVGKGVVSPHMTRYLVQNDVMRADLARYHGIEPNRVVVTGWPQTDVFSRFRPRAEYEALLADYGLDSTRPVVLVTGNTPTNTPYEGRFVERLVSWWKDSGAGERFSLLFRPHPRDHRWHERFAAATDWPGLYVQTSSYTDIETLACLLQHADCVVSNAGTILLDSLVNDRPAVCVLYDEGAPPGESWAAKNVTGEHYRELIESEAFYRAASFDDVVSGIERALERPDELAAERRRVAGEVVGEVDGLAGERVVQAIMTSAAGEPQEETFHLLARGVGSRG
jgi:UDP-N-acetylglucosamine:LPS N-acetylglucosamine transferase